MTVGEGVSVAEQFRNEAPEPSGSSTMLSRISSRLSASTAATFLPSQGGYGGSLHSLTRLINEHTALYYATIVSTECYAEAIIPGVVSHRFLLLELARPDKKTICVRLDRRRSRVTSTIRFVRLGGSTEAHDTVSSSTSWTGYNRPDLISRSNYPRQKMPCSSKGLVARTDKNSRLHQLSLISTDF